MGSAALLLLLNACANIIPPDGGAKDLIAPSLLRVEPRDQSVAQRPERLVFEFDEYIQVKDPNLVRWGLFPKGRYEVKARLKRLVVVLDLLTPGQDPHQAPVSHHGLEQLQQIPTPKWRT